MAAVHRPGTARRGDPGETYCPLARWATALCNGALEICITPAKGWAKSRMRKIAQDTASAQMVSVATTVALGEAKRPKRAKSTTSHEIRMTRKGAGIEPSSRWAA